MTETKCTCPYGGGDAGPMIWHCPEHGFTGLLGFDIRFQRQDVFPDKFDFWCFCMGVLKSEQAVKRHSDRGPYYDEDNLWTDVDRALMRLKSRWLPDLPSRDGQPQTAKQKLAYLDEIIEGFRRRKMSAITKGVVYLVTLERDRLAARIKDGVER